MEGTPHSSKSVYVHIYYFIQDFTNYFNDMRYSVIKLATLIHLLHQFKANHFRE